MELKIPEKKLLSEPCWIDLNDEVKVRIDYPTRSQEVELRRLQKIWFSGLARADTEHWMAYYLRSTIREVMGFSIEGKPAQLVLERGSALSLSNGTTSLDLIATLLELDLIEALGGMIMSRLEVTEVEKKRLDSPPSSSVTANSAQDGSPSSPEPRSSTAGIPSPQTAEKTS